VILRTFEDIKADIEINIIEIKKDHLLIYQIGICPSYKQTNYPQTQTHRGIPPATISLPPSLSPVDSSYGNIFSLSQSSGPRKFWTPCIL
jgi:hypothetical protein